MEPVILERESADPRYPWRQYLVVTDRRVVVVEMTPAMWGGWNIGRVTVQGPDDWGMERDAIVDWKRRHDDRARIVTLDPAFKSKLLSRCEVNHA